MLCNQGSFLLLLHCKRIIFILASSFRLFFQSMKFEYVSFFHVTWSELESIKPTKKTSAGELSVGQESTQWDNILKWISTRFWIVVHRARAVEYQVMKLKYKNANCYPMSNFDGNLRVHFISLARYIVVTSFIIVMSGPMSTIISQCHNRQVYFFFYVIKLVHFSSALDYQQWHISAATWQEGRQKNYFFLLLSTATLYQVTMSKVI